MVDELYKPMTLEQIAPELRNQSSQIPSLPVGSWLGRWVLRFGARLLHRQKDYDGVKIDDYRLPDGGRVRVYAPDGEKTDGALLWIHGGGLVIGHVKQDDAFCAVTARTLGVTVISAAYRLAPENPFPASLNDCYGAWQWILSHADILGIHKERVAIGGQSAGGGLAASLVQRLHDEGGIQPIAQWLFCPMLDDRTTLRRELDDVNHFIWNNRNNRAGWGAYLGRSSDGDAMPDYAVPARRGDLRGLPPAWIGISDIELFFDETLLYAERLRGAGIDCVLDIVAGAPHGFETFLVNTTLAQDYLGRGRTWLGEQYRRVKRT